jgi:hypothetical protein
MLVLGALQERMMGIDSSSHKKCAWQLVQFDADIAVITA